MNECCNATLKAERDRLLALTPEAVVEAAAEALMAQDLYNSKSSSVVWKALDPQEREVYLDKVRAALPVLVAREVAKREQVEKDLREELGEHADSIREWEKETEKRIAAESRLAEVARERNEACDSFRVEAAKLAGAERELEGALSAIDRWSARASAAEAERDRLKGALEKLAHPSEGACPICAARAALGGAK